MRTSEGVASAPKAQPRPVSLAFVAIYGAAYFGVWMALLTPVVVSLALRVAEIDPANKAANLSWILGLGAVVAMLANPIAGLFSDRTTSRLGMRRPWLIGGLLLGLLGLYLVATGGMALILIGWCAAQLGFNALLAAIVAILPDQVPETQRGRVAGALGLCSQLGVLGGVSLTQMVGGSTFLMFMLPGATAGVLVLLLCLKLDDRRLPPRQAAPLNLPGFFKSFLIDPRRAPDFAWAFVSRFLLFIGLATLVSYMVFYLIDQLHFARADIPAAMFKISLVQTSANVTGSLAGGWLSDRVGRRKAFVLLSALIYATGLAAVGLASTFGGILVGMAVCGLGQGVYLAVDLALVTQVLPNKHADAAKDLGIFNLASSVPQSIAPAIAPLFLAIGGGATQNFTALFIAAAVFAGLGALAILPVRGVR